MYESNGEYQGSLHTNDPKKRRTRILFAPKGPLPPIREGRIGGENWARLICLQGCVKSELFDWVFCLGKSMINQQNKNYQ